MPLANETSNNIVKVKYAESDIQRATRKASKQVDPKNSPTTSVQNATYTAFYEVKSL